MAALNYTSSKPAWASLFDLVSKQTNVQDLPQIQVPLSEIRSSGGSVGQQLLAMQAQGPGFDPVQWTGEISTSFAISNWKLSAIGPHGPVLSQCAPWAPTEQQVCNALGF